MIFSGTADYADGTEGSNGIKVSPSLSVVLSCPEISIGLDCTLHAQDPYEPSLHFIFMDDGAIDVKMVVSSCEG